MTATLEAPARATADPSPGDRFELLGAWEFDYSAVRVMARGCGSLSTGVKFEVELQGVAVAVRTVDAGSRWPLNEPTSVLPGDIVTVTWDRLREGSGG